MWRNFAISTPPAKEGQLDRLFLHKEHFIYKLSVKRQKTAQKTGKNPIKTCLFHACPKFLKWGIPQNRNSQNEVSLKTEIPKSSLDSRDPSKQEFLKWGIAWDYGQQMAPLVAVWKVINSPIFDIHCKYWNSSMKFWNCESQFSTEKHL